MERVPHLSTMPHQENVTATFSETCYGPQVSTIRSNDTSNYGNFNSQWKSQSTQGCTSLQKIDTTNSQFPSRNSSSFCPLNDGKHPLFQCTLFKNKSPQERYIVVQKLNYCFNCLRPYHKVTHAIQTLPKNSRKRLNTYVLAIPGATLQTFVPNKNKSMSFLLQYPLRKTENIILWHDIINKTISQHKSKLYKPCSPQKLIGSVLKIKHRLSAIIYCRRIGAPNVLQQLRSTGVLVIHLVIDLLPARQVRKQFIL